MIFHIYEIFLEKKRYIKSENFCLAFFDHLLTPLREWYYGMDSTDSGGNIAPVLDAASLTLDV